LLGETTRNLVVANDKTICATCHGDVAKKLAKFEGVWSVPTSIEEAQLIESLVLCPLAMWLEKLNSAFMENSGT
jgi:hypothetical protein